MLLRFSCVSLSRAVCHTRVSLNACIRAPPGSGSGFPALPGGLLLSVARSHVAHTKCPQAEELCCSVSGKPWVGATHVYKREAHERDACFINKVGEWDVAASVACWHQIQKGVRGIAMSAYACGSVCVLGAVLHSSALPCAPSVLQRLAEHGVDQHWPWTAVGALKRTAAHACKRHAQPAHALGCHRCICTYLQLNNRHSTHGTLHRALYCTLNNMCSHCPLNVKACLSMDKAMVKACAQANISACCC